MSSIDTSKPILVYLAGGVQGGAVVRAALRRGWRVRALVRERTRCSTLESLGVELVTGDLDDIASLRAASEGVGHVVLQVPIGRAQEMLARARNALSAAATASVRSLVLKLASASRPAPCEEASFVANAMIEEASAQSGLPFAIVRPTMYLENLLKPSARAEIVEHGVFAPPLPAAQRIAWTSVEDCAEAAATLLERGACGDYRIAGPESLTGDELAARIGLGLGRPVAYRAQPIEEFERDVDAEMGAGVGRRVASKFRYFAAYPDEAEAILAAPFVPRAGLQGFKPTGVETWVHRHRDAFLGDRPCP